MPQHHRGGRTKPTALKLLTGSNRIPKDEPQLPTDIKTPEHLSALALKYWERTKELLLTSRIACESDEVALAAFAEVYAQWSEATRELNKDSLNKSMYHINRFGECVISTKWKLQSELTDKLMRYSIEFGMTPSSRGRVQVPKEKKPEGFGGLKNVKKAD